MCAPDAASEAEDKDCVDPFSEGMKQASASIVPRVGASIAAALTLAVYLITQTKILWSISDTDVIGGFLAPAPVSLPEAVKQPTVHIVPLAEDPSVTMCSVWIPPAAPGTKAELSSRLLHLYESAATPFPFTNSEAGYFISEEETEHIGKVVDEAFARTPPMKADIGRPDETLCHSSTYDGPRPDALASLFSPGGPGEAGAGDAVVDLGAGIGKQLVAAALVSNASLIRGIELGESRYADGCKVLKTLEQLFVQRPELGASGPRRRVELVHGDLFAPPAGFFADLPERVVFYSYCNCFPYRLIKRIFAYAADLGRESVRLLASKAPLTPDLPLGLRRAGNTGTVLSEFYERSAGAVGGTVAPKPAAAHLREGAPPSTASLSAWAQPARVLWGAWSRGLGLSS